MSAYITLATPMINEECLIAALVDNEIAESAIMRSAVPVNLRGWQGGRQANIVLQREHTGDRHNDIGFLKTTSGYLAILSDDHARFGQAWLARVNASYQSHWTLKQELMAAAERQKVEEELKRVVEAQRQTINERAKRLGYLVKETREGDRLRIVLIRRTY